MKVLVDEMYPPAVAEALRASGIDATTVADLRLGGAPDAEIFRAAAAGVLALVGLSGVVMVGSLLTIAAVLTPIVRRTSVAVA